MLPGPQSSEHKCQLDYQPNWHGFSLAFPEPSTRLRARSRSSEDCNSQSRHLNQPGQWGGAILRLVLSTPRCTPQECTCMHKHTTHTQVSKIHIWLGTHASKPRCTCLVSWKFHEIRIASWKDKCVGFNGEHRNFCDLFYIYTREKSLAVIP